MKILLFSLKHLNATESKRLQLFSHPFPPFVLSFKVFHLNENSVGVFVVSGGWVCTMVRAWDISQLESNSVSPSSFLSSYWLFGETASEGCESGVGGARQCIKNQVSVLFTLQCSTVLYMCGAEVGRRVLPIILFLLISEHVFPFLFSSGGLSLKRGTSGLQALGDCMGQLACVRV